MLAALLRPMIGSLCHPALLHQLPSRPPTHPMLITRLDDGPSSNPCAGRWTRRGFLRVHRRGRPAHGTVTWRGTLLGQRHLVTKLAWALGIELQRTARPAVLRGTERTLVAHVRRPESRPRRALVMSGMGEDGRGRAGCKHHQPQIQCFQKKYDLAYDTRNIFTLCRRAYACCCLGSFSRAARFSSHVCSWRSANSASSVCVKMGLAVPPLSWNRTSPSLNFCAALCTLWSR